MVESSTSQLALILLLTVGLVERTSSFVVVPSTTRPSLFLSSPPTITSNNVLSNDYNNLQSFQHTTTTRCNMAKEIIIIVGNNDDDDDEEEEEEEEEEEQEEDPYTKLAASEFEDTSSSSSSSSSALVTKGSISSNSPTTNMDWGGALGSLRKRVDDVESGKSGNPSLALFRVMSAEAPNQMIDQFVRSANPQVVQAMSGAVESLLGGLNNPATGIETIVKATGDKIGSLCFQLQMTGYMFRNAEYVIALKKIMQIRGKATLQDYKDAFKRLDKDNSGFIETTEVVALLNDVYKDKSVPAFEVNAFMKFFDKNEDGRISWDEFERGLGAVFVNRAQAQSSLHLLSAGPSNDEDDEDDEDDIPLEAEPEVSGTLEIELEDGKVVEVDAKEYIKNLKEEARTLKATLAREKLGDKNGSNGFAGAGGNPSVVDEFGGIASYIASRQGDVKGLTEGISPEVVETMKMLVDFVLEGGESGKGKKNIPKEEMEMEIPGSALQQLALWQLILGYRLRESEAKGDYLRLLE